MSEYKAYYYGFDPTNVAEVDGILRAVANAGSGYHHTENWNDDDEGEGSPVNKIQAAANSAAEKIARLTADKAKLVDALKTIVGKDRGDSVAAHVAVAVIKEVQHD